MSAVGITGTRDGCTPEQLRRLEAELNHRAKPGMELHHGDCKGVDEQASVIAWTHGYHVVSHPPSNSRLRAFCVVGDERDPAEYLKRNRAIVAEADEMIACPKDGSARGGTWYTIRHSIMEGVPVLIIWSDGTVEQR